MDNINKYELVVACTDLFEIYSKMRKNNEISINLKCCYFAVLTKNGKRNHDAYYKCLNTVMKNLKNEHLESYKIIMEFVKRNIIVTKTGKIKEFSTSKFNKMMFKAFLLDEDTLSEISSPCISRGLPLENGDILEILEYLYIM
jgi:hypothetical protein